MRIAGTYAGWRQRHQKLVFFETGLTQRDFLMRQLAMPYIFGFMQQNPKDVGAWNADFNEKNKPQTFLDAAHREVKGFVGGTPEGSKATGMPVEKGPPPEENVVTVPNDASQRTIFDLAKNTPINKRLLLPDGSYIWGQKK